LYRAKIYINFNIGVLYLLAPYENAPENYFTLKNFFWPAEP
jgi:hypothetical protein